MVYGSIFCCVHVQSLFDDFDYGDDEDEDARLAEQQRRMEADQHRLQSNT